MRYRVVAAGFAGAVAVGPVALALSMFREAPAARAAATPAPNAVALLAVPALVAAGCIGALLLAALALDVVKLRRVKREATPLGVAPVRRAAIGTSRVVATPTAIGYVHPAVVMPVGFRAQVDAREWDAVIAHECAHLARLDDWAKALQSAVVRLAWWMPGLWLLGRALDLERELASDEEAAIGTGTRAYAACLLRLATGRGAAVAPGFGGRRAHVAIRVERLLRPSVARGPLVRAAVLGISTAAAIASVAAAVLALPGAHVTVAAPPRIALERAPHVERHAAFAHRAPAGTVAVVARTPRAAVRAFAAAPHRRPAPAAHRPIAERAHAAPAVVAAIAERSRRPATRPAARSRMPAGAVETIAFVAPVRRCAACSAPMLTPDMPAPSPAGPVRSGPAAGAAPAGVAVAADDPTSGPVNLNAQLLWARMPIRALMAP